MSKILKENFTNTSEHSMLAHKVTSFFWKKENILYDMCKQTKKIQSIVILEHQDLSF
jgi:hypothetical protein